MGCWRQTWCQDAILIAAAVLLKPFLSFAGQLQPCRQDQNQVARAFFPDVPELVNSVIIYKNLVKNAEAKSAKRSFASKITN